MREDYIIQERRPVEYYYDLDGTLFEENTVIPSVYVVRCRISGDAYEDEADFETLEEAQECLKRLKGEK